MQRQNRQTEVQTIINQFNREQKEREAPVSPEDVTLVKAIRLDQSDTEKQKKQYELVQDGVSLINNAFIECSGLNTIYKELSLTFKEQRIILEEINKAPKGSNTAHLHLLFRKKSEDAKLLSNKLRQIKAELNLKNIKESAKGDISKEWALRFEHLPADKLIHLSEIVAVVKQKIATQCNTINQSHFQKLDQNLALVLQGIIDNMKARIENEPPHRKLNIALDESKQEANGLYESFIDIPQNKIDPSADQGPPKSLFNQDTSEFGCANAYFLYYVHRYGKEEDQKWSKEKGLPPEPKSYINKLNEIALYYFDPKSNPYTGILCDFAGYTTENYLGPLWNKTKDITKDVAKEFNNTLEDTINQMRGNRVAVKLNEIGDRIYKNENFKEIEKRALQNVGSVVSWFHYAYTTMRTYVTAPPSATEENSSGPQLNHSSLSQSLLNTSDPGLSASAMANSFIDLIPLDPNEAFYEKLNEDVKAQLIDVDEMQKEIEREMAEINEMGSDWVCLVPAKKEETISPPEGKKEEGLTGLDTEQPTYTHETTQSGSSDPYEHLDLSNIFNEDEEDDEENPNKAEKPPTEETFEEKRVVAPTDNSPTPEEEHRNFAVVKKALKEFLETERERITSQQKGCLGFFYWLYMDQNLTTAKLLELNKQIQKIDGLLSQEALDAFINDLGKKSGNVLTENRGCGFAKKTAFEKHLEEFKGRIEKFKGLHGTTKNGP